MFSVAAWLIGPVSSLIPLLLLYRYDEGRRNNSKSGSRLCDISMWYLYPDFGYRTTWNGVFSCSKRLHYSEYNFCLTDCSNTLSLHWQYYIWAFIRKLTVPTVLSQHQYQGANIVRLNFVTRVYQAPLRRCHNIEMYNRDCSLWQSHQELQYSTVRVTFQ